MTLPRDRTLGHGEGVPYGVPEQPGAYMSGPTDVSIRLSLPRPQFTLGQGLDVRF